MIWRKPFVLWHYVARFFNMYTKLWYSVYVLWWLEWGLRLTEIGDFLDLDEKNEGS